MLSVRLLANSGLFVVKFLGRQKLYVDFFTAQGTALLIPMLVKSQLYCKMSVQTTIFIIQIDGRLSKYFKRRIKTRIYWESTMYLVPWDTLNMLFPTTLTKTLKGSIYLHCRDEKSKPHLSQKGTHLHFYCFAVITPASSIVAGRIWIWLLGTQFPAVSTIWWCLLKYV